MRRIKLVVGVLAMLVVMVGSAVPAMAQQRGDHGNRGHDYGRGYDYGRVNYYNYWNSYCMGTIPTNHGWDNFFEVIE
jgi:glucose uptake protein GlcU